MKTQFVCQNCAYVSLKWLGKCPNCASWDSFREELTPDKTNAGTAKPKIAVNQISSGLTRLNQVSRAEEQSGNAKLNFQADQLQDFWGDGIQSGSLTLLAGEPGFGKSTFALQILRDVIKANSNLETMYVSAEESLPQLAERARRLKIPDTINALTANSLEQIVFEILQFQRRLQDQAGGDLDSMQAEGPRPHPKNQIFKTALLVVIDSVQTIFSTVPTGSPGSVSQVTYIVNSLLALAKSHNITILLIGHVTKSGDIAGPKTMEHMVDSVLLLDQPQTSSRFRSLYFTKHRFGSTNRMLLLEMQEQGLVIIKNPSLVLIENLESGIGVAYSLAFDRQIPLLVEIQALVHQTANNFGRREANGISNTRLNIIVAIIEKYLRLDLKNADIYLQVLGLPKGLQEDSLDLAILLAVLSSLKDIALDQLVPPLPSKTTPLDKTKNASTTAKKANSTARSVYFGRLTLSGSIRNATNQAERDKASQKLGFVPNPGLSSIKSVAELKYLFS